MRFSRHGTLVNTCVTLVGSSVAGYATDALGHLPQVQTKEPLLKLTRQARI